MSWLTFFSVQSFTHAILSNHVESQRLGQSWFTLPAGTGGVVVGEEIIRWSHDYSAWELFALETCQIFHTPGVGTGNGVYLGKGGVVDEGGCMFHLHLCIFQIPVLVGRLNE